MFHAPDDAAGRTARCPNCGGGIPIPAPVPITTAESKPAESGTTDSPDFSAASLERRPCPMCGESIPARANICEFCGEPLYAATAAQAIGSGSAVPMASLVCDRDIAILLFVTSLVACFSPILAVYGIVFLAKRPYSFELKGLAIAGTVIHCLWAVTLLAGLLLMIAIQI